MLSRALQPKLLALAQGFQVISLTGPRQSGKTTLVRATFPHLPYVSLEEPDMRLLALTDPRGFLSNYPNGAILDEIQHVPDLFSYIQRLVDDNRHMRFVLTGSANFLLMERLSQSLAGRAAVAHLLPLALAELSTLPATYEEILFTGLYPRLYDRPLAPADFYGAYLQTYVERDVRLLKNIGDLNAFIQFTQLCAGRIGQLLNVASLASDAGLSPNTAKAWLSVLESSFILYRLQPCHRNFNKRLVKSPKLYFYDTGLACALLGVRSVEQATTHYLKGALFENLILNELVKRQFNRGEHRAQPCFWQDNRGREIDGVLETGAQLTGIEIKAGKTFTPSYFDNLNAWRALGDLSPAAAYVVYGGDHSLRTSQGVCLSWRELERLPA